MGGGRPEELVDRVRVVVGKVLTHLTEAVCVGRGPAIVRCCGIGSEGGPPSRILGSCVRIGRRSPVGTCP